MNKLKKSFKKKSKFLRFEKNDQTIMKNLQMTRRHEFGNSVDERDLKIANIFIRLEVVRNFLNFCQIFQIFYNKITSIAI